MSLATLFQIRCNCGDKISPRWEPGQLAELKVGKNEMGGSGVADHPERPTTHGFSTTPHHHDEGKS